jgi:iron complex outermembrane receptor protein
MKMFFQILCTCSAIALFAVPMTVVWADKPAAAQESREDILQEVVVTARRKEESAQTVPVAIIAFSPDQLERATVQSLNDISFLTPGLRVSSEGGASVSSVSMRGQSKLPVGDSVPAVVIYFNEVSLPNVGVDLSTYDLANVQVLKGPQGTLFGRNVLGGAVLLQSQSPSYDWTGYAKGSLGDYNYRAIEAAQNISLVDGKLAVRLAGQIRARDGFQTVVGESLPVRYGAPFNTSYTFNNPGSGLDFGNLNQHSFRASVLFQPNDSLTNTTVVDYFRANERPEQAVPFAWNSGFLPAVLAPGFAGLLGIAGAAVLANGYNNGIGQAIAVQRVLNPYHILQKLGVDYLMDRETIGVVNKTTYQINDDLQVKNIFGFRLATEKLGGVTDGIPLVPGPFGNFTVYAPSDQIDARNMLSDEIQFQGKAFNNRLDYTTGAIYSRDIPDGAGGIATNAFAFSPSNQNFLSNYTTQAIGSSNQGLYAQFSFDLSEWVVDGLKVTLGGRDSWDEAFGCGTSATTTSYVSYNACANNFSKTVRLHDDNMTSYTMGLDWQIDKDLFAYAVHRRGYRGVAVNTPLFFSQYTTGGTGCFGTGKCPDLRPFQGTKPDTIIDYEIGLKSTYNWNGVKGKFNIDAYDSLYHNLVEFVNFQGLIPATAPDGPESGALGINVANENIKGIEIEAGVIPMHGLTLSANGAYTDQELNGPPAAIIITQNEGVTQPSPRFSGTVAVEYVAPFDVFGGVLIFSADDFYTGASRAQVGFQTKGYNIVNTKVDLRNIADKDVDLGFWIRNALNRTYISAPYVVISNFPLSSGAYGEPRMIGVNLTYHW